MDIFIFKYSASNCIILTVIKWHFFKFHKRKELNKILRKRLLTEMGNDHLIEFHLTESVDRKFLII